MKPGKFNIFSNLFESFDSRKIGFYDPDKKELFFSISKLFFCVWNGTSAADDMKHSNPVENFARSGDNDVNNVNDVHDHNVNDDDDGGAALACRVCRKKCP